MILNSPFKVFLDQIWCAFVEYISCHPYPACQLCQQFCSGKQNRDLWYRWCRQWWQQQEFIPVGCVPPACSHSIPCRGGVCTQGVCIQRGLHPGGLHSWGSASMRRGWTDPPVMWPVMHAGKPTPLPWTDKHLWKHYLALKLHLREVMKKKQL